MASQKKRKKPEQRWYPCVPTPVNPGERGYDKGIRFRVEDFDGKLAHFMTKERLVEILTLHDMIAVPPEKMSELRQQQQRTIPA